MPGHLSTIFKNFGDIEKPIDVSIEFFNPIPYDRLMVWLDLPSTPKEKAGCEVVYYDSQHSFHRPIHTSYSYVSSFFVSLQSHGAIDGWMNRERAHFFITVKKNVLFPT